VNLPTLLKSIGTRTLIKRATAISKASKSKEVQPVVEKEAEAVIPESCEPKYTLAEAVELITKAADTLSISKNASSDDVEVVEIGRNCIGKEGTKLYLARPAGD